MAGIDEATKPSPIHYVMSRNNLWIFTDGKNFYEWDLIVFSQHPETYTGILSHNNTLNTGWHSATLSS